MTRHPLPYLILLAAALHAVGIALTPLPAQDGLKFIRVARQFHHQPWAGVVRGADQHPLYPALIALAQPAASLTTGPGPDSWRIAAQGVSAVASLALLVPLFGLTRRLFNERTATLAVFLFVLLPLPAEVGHDTLADPLALLGIATSLWLGEKALRSRGMGAPLGCGLAAGVGYLARPEVLIAPMAVGMVAVGMYARHRWANRPERVASWTPRFATMSVAALALVGAYGVIKGEVSEKLALRHATGTGGGIAPPRRVVHQLPPGLDDPRWDFSPKEEFGHPRSLPFRTAGARLAGAWAEGLGWVLAPLAFWGLLCVRARRWQRPAMALAAVYLVAFGAILTRHAMALGYLSGRHTLSMVLLTVPFAAAGAFSIGTRLARRFHWSEPRVRRLAYATIAASLAVGATLQMKSGHPSRWGHLAAGRWLAEHASDSESVLDTRGWAAFVSGRKSYDYWHVRQALTDSQLTYVVVGADELNTPSRRAATLRAMLSRAGTQVAAFPEREGGRTPGIFVYRFRHPGSWEGLEG
jgi:hypothetical protein